MLSLHLPWPELSLPPTGGEARGHAERRGEDRGLYSLGAPTSKYYIAYARVDLGRWFTRSLGTSFCLHVTVWNEFQI